MPIFTIGYGNRSASELIDLLHGLEADLLVDVRSMPFSGFRRELNKPALEGLLQAEGIEYLWMGDRLGGRPDNPALYDEQGYVDYQACREDFLFAQGFAQLQELEDGGRRVFLMCSELRPEECHRSRIVAEALVSRSTEVQHVDADGQIISHAQAIGRLQGGQQSFFDPSPSHPLNRSDRRIGPPGDNHLAD